MWKTLGGFTAQISRFQNILPLSTAQINCSGSDLSFFRKPSLASMLRGMSSMFLAMIRPHQYCSSNVDIQRSFILDPTRFTPVSVIKVFFHGNQNSSTTTRNALQRSSLIVAAQRPLATPSPAASIPIKRTEGSSLHKVS
jgi:hypothetical protein